MQSYSADLNADYFVLRVPLDLMQLGPIRGRYPSSPWEREEGERCTLEAVLYLRVRVRGMPRGLFAHRTSHVIL